MFIIFIYIDLIGTGLSYMRSVEVLQIPVDNFLFLDTQGRDGLLAGLGVERCW